MAATIDRLRSLRVRDAMSSPVVVLATCHSMSEAAEILREHHISGAPVVDDKGQCVGLLSASDFVEAGKPGVCHHDYHQEIVQDFPGGPYHVEEFFDDLVSDFMSPVVQTVSDDMSLTAAAKCMCLEHIHRLVVVDSQSRPVGILSSLDVVAAVVAAVDERTGTPSRARR